MGRGFFLVGLSALGFAACSPSGVVEATVRFEIEPAALSFGEVLVQGEARLEAVARNRGRGRVEVEAGELPEGFAIEPRSFRLAPGAEQPLTIVFAPSAAKEYDAAISLRPGAAETSASIHVNGRGVETALAAPSDLDFGHVLLGESRALELPIENLSDGALEIHFGLEEGSGFSAPLQALTLDAREREAVSLRFSPADPGAVRSILSMRPCQGCEVEEVALRGFGTEYNLLAAPDRVDFGRVPPGLAAERRLTITNPGANTVVIDQFVWDPLLPFPPIEITGLDLPLSLAAGSDASFQLSYAPLAAGEEERSLRFYDAEESLLLETQVTARAGGPMAEVVPSELDFGLQPQGRQVSRRVKIENTGELEPLQITSLHLQGDQRDSYSVVHEALPFEVGLSPGEFLVSAEARSPGVHDAEIIIELDSKSQPQLRIPLRLEALEPTTCEIEFDTEELRFGSVRAKETWLFFEWYQTVRELELRNVGTEDCLLWGASIEGDSAAYFRIVEAPPDVFVLEPGARLRVPIEIDVLEAPEEEALYAEFIVSKESGLGPVLKSLPLSGMNRKYAPLSDMPVWPEFEPVPVGRAALATPLMHLGSIFSVRLSSDSSPDFFFANMRGGFTEIGFSPSRVGNHRGQLEYHPLILNEVRLSRFPFLLDFEATATPPCTDCDWPEPFCWPDETIEVASGFDYDDPGWVHACHWSLELEDREMNRYSKGTHIGVYNAPSASYPNLFVGDPWACHGNVQAITVGNFTLRSLRARPDGRAAACRTEVEVQPPEGLWVEIFRGGVGSAGILHGNLDPSVEAHWSEPGYGCSFLAQCPLEATEYKHQARMVAMDGWESFHVPAPDRSGVPYFFGTELASVYQGEPIEFRVYCDETLVASQSLIGTAGKFTVIGSVQFTGDSGCTFSPDGNTTW